MMSAVEIHEEASPLLLCFPHSGLEIPKEIWKRLNAAGKECVDTDWHVDRLYQGLFPNATQIKANFHRYVIDPNRPPDGTPLYHNQHTTTLVPLTDFNGTAIYRDTLSNEEVKQQLKFYYEPYHTAVKEQIERIKAHFGYVLLIDCHSIRRSIPYLFSGHMCDLNIGTNRGKSCHPKLEEALLQNFQQQKDYTYAFNKQFIGGWTTRHYGRPSHQVHALQIELSQKTYMQEHDPWEYLEEKAKPLRVVLQTILNTLVEVGNELN